MPNLLSDSALLAGFDPSSVLVPMPEQGSVWSQAPSLIAGGKVAKQLFAISNYNSFTSVAQHALSQIGMAVGVPEWAAGAFQTFFQLAPKPGNAEELAKGIVAGTAQLVQQSLSQASTAVPIVGVIVQIGLYLWDIIDRALATLDEVKRPPEQAIVYEFQNDLEAAGLLKIESGQPDWTTIFAPPAVEGWRLSEISWTPGGGTEGFKFEIHPHKLQDFGLMPGIAERLGTYQFPRLAVGSSRPWDFYTGYGLSTTGQLLPSGRKFAALLWQTAMKPSVAMFQIDSEKIEDAWAGYFDSLWAYSNTKFEQNYSDATANTIRWAIRRACTYCRIKASTKGPFIARESQIDQFPIDKLQKAFGTENLSYLYTDIISYVCQIHRARAAKALRTIVCAYVPPTAPLLRASPALADLHHEMRLRLLTHPDRYDVELDLIPDKAYRTAMDEAQVLNVGPGPGDIVGHGPGVPQRIPTPVDHDDLLPGPDQGLPQGQTPSGASGTVKTPLGFDIRHLAGIAVAGLGIGAATYYFDDDLRRIISGMRARARR